MPSNPTPILDVQALCISFKIRSGEVCAVNDVSFSLNPGELLGVVGESGSGKSVAMMSLIRLLPSPPAWVRSGRILFEGQDVLTMLPQALRSLRAAKIGFVFQDPMTSLNPVFSIGFQLMEPMRKHLGYNKKCARKRAAELLNLVGIPDATRRLRDFPYQFSGGMRQRVGIAMALACAPKVLIADEPTTALDVTIQAQILELIKGLRKKLGMAIIWITHDLGVIAEIADRVVVMYGGQIVEHAPVQELFNNPQHPYTCALLKALPSLAQDGKLISIKGQPPILTAPPEACCFAPRCDHCINQCLQSNPIRQALGNNHDCACYNYKALQETR